MVFEELCFRISIWIIGEMDYLTLEWTQPVHYLFILDGMGNQDGIIFCINRDVAFVECLVEEDVQKKTVSWIEAVLLIMDDAVLDDWLEYQFGDQMAGVGCRHEDLIGEQIGCTHLPELEIAFCACSSIA